jgi:beta-glucosidase
VGQLPVFYSQPNTQKANYVEASSSPLYNFGYGLSYTTFQYDSLKIYTNSISSNEKINVEFTVKNTGLYDGDEVVQLYLKDNVSSVVTASRQLKYFQRTNLKVGESKVVHFQLGRDDMALYNRKMERVVEPGSFTVMIGSSSDRIFLKGTFNITNQR